MEDPGIWGPIVIVISVIFSADMICRKLAENHNKMLDELRTQHKETLDYVIGMEASLRDASVDLGYIKDNTESPSSTND